MNTAGDTTITVDGDTVVKIHRAGTDPQELAARLRIASGSGCLLTPLSTDPEPITAVGGERWRTRWPRITPIPQHPGALPWSEAGALLARLHRSPLPADGDIPAHGAVRSLRRALDGLPAGAPPEVRQAATALPPRAWRTATSGRPLTVVSGDLHLGQLGLGADDRLLLFDVDDLGAGDPAWDLARPAGFWASGDLRRRRVSSHPARPRRSVTRPHPDGGGDRPANTTLTGPALNGAAHNFTMPRVTFQPPTSVDPP
jgi:hypothetical protein